MYMSVLRFNTNACACHASSASGVRVSVTLIQGHWLCLASWHGWHGWLQCTAVGCCRLDAEWVMCSGQWSPFAQVWLALSPSLCGACHHL
jgi:hypothetical protein